MGSAYQDEKRESSHSGLSTEYQERKCQKEVRAFACVCTQHNFNFPFFSPKRDSSSDRAHRALWWINNTGRSKPPEKVRAPD